MSGWIKVEKSLESDPRTLRIARELSKTLTMFSGPTEEDGRFDPCNALAYHHVTLVCGALARLWMYADTHIRDDDTLDMGAAEIDDWLGIPNFCSTLPDDWLTEIDENTVELPGFQSHNGVDAKKKALTAKRVERHRKGARNGPALPVKEPCNAPALPDQTRLDQTRPDVRTTTVAPRPAKADPPEFAHIRSAYPKRGGSQPWPRALKAAQARIREGDTWTDLLDGVSRYAEFVRATGKEGTEYVLQAATFFGPDKRYLEPWAAPATKADARYSANVSTARTWAEGQS